MELNASSKSTARGGGSRPQKPAISATMIRFRGSTLRVCPLLRHVRSSWTERTKQSQPRRAKPLSHHAEKNPQSFDRIGGLDWIGWTDPQLVSFSAGSNRLISAFHSIPPDRPAGCFLGGGAGGSRVVGLGRSRARPFGQDDTERR